MIEQLLQAERELTVDRVDRAEAIYRGVTEVDPNNAMAVTGLARCALARGDDRRAYELAATALTIDPQNDVARRLEARLAEVLRTRGEAVARPAAADDLAPAAPPGVVPSPAAPSAASPVAHGTPAPSAAEEPRGLMARLLRR